MTRGDKVQLNDYHLMAAIDYTSAASVALVVRRGSTHLFVMRADVTIPRSQPLMSGEAVYVSAYPYFHEEKGDFDITYTLALRQATNMAIGAWDDAS